MSRALAGAGVILFLSPLQALCENQPALFEVATVKANRSSETRGSIDFEKGGRLNARNVPLKSLIAEAFHARPDALSGLPGWTETERFDIVAKAPPNTSPEDLRSMMRALLEDRFKLAVHADTKVGQAFALVGGQRAQSLKPSAPARAVDGGCRRRRAAVSGDFALACEHMSMSDLADILPDAAGGYIDAPVIDQTGMEGFYDFNLFWTPARLMDGSGGSGAPSSAGSGTTVFHALQDQLGLKLESRRLPLPIIVIDHVEKAPIEN